MAAVATPTNAGNNAFKVDSIDLWRGNLAKSRPGQREADGSAECKYYGSSRYAGLQITKLALIIHASCCGCYSDVFGPKRHGQDDTERKRSNDNRGYCCTEPSFGPDLE